MAEKTRKEYDNEKAIEIEHRITEIDNRSKGNSHRIDRLEPVVNEIHTLSETMVKLVEQTKTTNKNVEELKTKVDKIEREPAEKYKYVQRTIWTSIITTIVGAIIGALIGYFIK